MEYTRTGQNTYIHTAWFSGLSNDRKILGHPLGRDAHGVYLIWSRDWNRWISIQNTLFASTQRQFGSEKQAGVAPQIEWNLGRFVFLDLAGQLSWIHLKRNTPALDTYEWGALASLSKRF